MRKIRKTHLSIASLFASSTDSTSAAAEFFAAKSAKENCGIYVVVPLAFVVVVVVVVFVAVALVVVVVSIAGLVATVDPVVE